MTLSKIVSIFFFIFIMLIINLHARKVSFSISRLDAEIKALSAENDSLNGSLARRTSPEYVQKTALKRGFCYYSASSVRQLPELELPQEKAQGWHLLAALFNFGKNGEKSLASAG